jgi:hypothetical protein
VTQECLVSYWQDVYNVTASSIVEGVVRGLNATIFAYGATGRYVRQDMFSHSARVIICIRVLLKI